MTTFLRDCSDFDPDPVDITGMAGLTHKATEGTSVLHAKYGPRMNAWHGAVPVLGSYHVLRTPGSGGAGSLAQQLAYWVARMDNQTPWWRSHPHWVMQIDAEKWSYDSVSASTVLQFAGLLANSGLPGWKVTYASRGQYGDSLAGIATPLWNADYRGAPNYPGDGWTAADKGAVAGWAPYSGQTPVLLQYRGGPDLNAFRGPLGDLLALTGGQDMLAPDELQLLRDTYTWARAGVTGRDSDGKVFNDPYDGAPSNGTRYLTEIAGKLDALAAPSSPDVTALSAKVDALTAKVDQVLARLTAAGDALDG